LALTLPRLPLQPPFSLASAWHVAQVNLMGLGALTLSVMDWSADHGCGSSGGHEARHR
jgi:hypothetical protein